MKAKISEDVFSSVKKDKLLYKKGVEVELIKYVPSSGEAMALIEYNGDRRYIDVNKLIIS